MYAIIDTETTGGNPLRDRVTEIAIILHDGKKELSKFTTLINPCCSIPYYISQITGITDEMVLNAPRFHEIARDIVELTENAVIVAHNVNFDYNFIRNEFSRLGYDYRREKLCTVRLSHKLIPGLKSYSLGNLCRDLNIEVTGRHRALGDATATSRLFELLVRINSQGKGDHLSAATPAAGRLNPMLDPATFEKLPEAPGVYYFYNERQEIIYIGKSRNIKKRVLSHFTGLSSRRAIEMCDRTADISYELTGNELIALLMESEEIKKHKPYYNRAQKRSSFQYGLYSQTDKEGYIRYSIAKTSLHVTPPLVCFASKAEGKEYMARIVDRYELCQKLCGLYESAGNCFHYEIGSCRGACAGKESPESYNVRAELAIRPFLMDHESMIIIDTGRHKDERSAVRVEKGTYGGYGYFNVRYAAESPSLITDCIIPKADSREACRLIRQYLRKNRVEKILVC